MTMSIIRNLEAVIFAIALVIVLFETFQLMFRGLRKAEPLSDFEPVPERRPIRILCVAPHISIFYEDIVREFTRKGLLLKDWSTGKCVTIDGTIFQYVSEFEQTQGYDRERTFYLRLAPHIADKRALRLTVSMYNYGYRNGDFIYEYFKEVQK